jgi:hypothetical protein
LGAAPNGRQSRLALQVRHRSPPEPRSLLGRKGQACRRMELSAAESSEVSSRPSGGEGVDRARRASQNREWFEHRPTWGANFGSRELQAAPWLTRDPGGAIHRGLAFYARYRNSLRVQREARCDSLFEDRHIRDLMKTSRNRQMALRAGGGSGRLGAERSG